VNNPPNCEMPPNTIHHGDCLEVMPRMDAESVDGIVTDPPYGLGFMGKDWDHGVPGEHFWREALRVAKPGAHLLAFGGTRTFHRLACAIEDAGWELRDSIGVPHESGDWGDCPWLAAWVYGQGFPKSLDVSKAIDKVNGEIGRDLKFTAWMRTTGLTSSQIDHITGTNMGGHYLTAASQPAVPTRVLFELLRPHITIEIPGWIETLIDRVEAERDVVGRHPAPAKSIYTQGVGEMPQDVDVTTPATDAAAQWDGWGTALKPAWEPIIMARRPFKGTVAANVLKHGTGAINVDGCRIAGEPTLCHDGQNANANTYCGGWANYKKGNGREYQNIGRWPANVITDGSDEVLAGFPETKSGNINGVYNNTIMAQSAGNRNGKPIALKFAGDSGSAARFFYCAKSSRAEREAGLEGVPERPVNRYGEQGQGPQPKQTPRITQRNRNHHPTVKPVALMRYLCRLITPPDGVILDPFAGSGSTGVAAVQEGFGFVGIDKDAEYCDIARARIAHALGPLFAGATK